MEIGSYSSCRGNPGFLYDIPDHLHDHVVRRIWVVAGMEPQVFREVEKALVDGVDMDIVRADIAQVD